MVLTMGRVYSNQLVLIPPGSKVYSDHKVFGPPTSSLREKLIGYAASKTMMHPFLNYFLLYGQGQSAPGSPVCPDTLKVGFYALVLGVAQTFGIYAKLLQAFGVHDANQIMDHVMSLIRERRNTATAIEGEITFTGMPLTDQLSSEWLSPVHDEDAIQAVLDQWLRKSVTGSLESVYLVMAGFHGDGTASDSPPADPAGPAGWRGLIWAVRAARDFAGLPIPYFKPIDGNLTVDTIREVEQYFQKLGVSIQGVLCDQDFSNRETLLTLRETGLPYMVQLQKDTAGFQTMAKEWTTRIRNPSDFLGDGVYGFTGNAQIFSDMDFSFSIATFYSPKTRGEEEQNLVSAVSHCTQELKRSIRRRDPVSVPKEMERYLHIDSKGNKRTVCFDEMAYQAELQTLGISCIATSDEQTALKAKTIYGYRKVADKATAYFKRLMGDGVFPVQSDACTMMKLFTCSVAARIWYHIQVTCKSLGRDVGEMIEDLGDIQYHLVRGAYQFVPWSLNIDMITLLGQSGISLGDLRDFETEVSRRYGRQSDPVERQDSYNVLPWPQITDIPNQGGNTTHTRSRKEKSQTDSANDSLSGQAPKHPGGRPKGSKNKATLAREVQEAARRKALGLPEPKKPKPRRPVGSKDSKRTRSTKAQMAGRRKNLEVGTGQ